MIILYIILFLFLTYLTIGAMLFFKACCRVSEKPWLDPKELAKTTFGKFSSAIQSTNQWIEEHNPQDIWIRSKDGLKLHGLWIKAENPIATILLVHGYHSTYLVDFSSALSSYHDQGFNLLIPDQRCHGKSEGHFTTFGVKESQDMMCWLNYLSTKLWEGPIILSGMSMGASTVLFMADEPLSENVKGIIADCGYTSPADIIGKVFTDVTHLPAVPWIYSTELFARVLGGFSLWEKDTVRSLNNNTRVVFLAHGSADDFVPCTMSQKAYTACGGDCTLLLVEGAGHGVSYLKDKEHYSKQIRNLFIKCLGESYELRNYKEL